MGHTSRREFLRSAGLATAAAILAGCDTAPPLQVSLTPELTTFLKKEEADIIRQVFQQYITAYNPPTNNISFGLDTGLSRARPGEVVEETASPGVVIFSSTLLDKSRQTNGQWKLIKDLTAHALTHACVPQQNSPTIKFKMDETHSVVAYRGLTVITDVADDNFSSFEEGLAEALARKLIGEYSWATGYRNLGSFTYSLLEGRNLFATTAKHCQTSNVPGFVQLITGAEPSPKQILHLATTFQRARNGENMAPYLSDPRKLQV